MYAGAPLRSSRIRIVRILPCDDASPKHHLPSLDGFHSNMFNVAWGLVMVHCHGPSYLHSLIEKNCLVLNSFAVIFEP
jgi:hypothetical protein